MAGSSHRNVLNLESELQAGQAWGVGPRVPSVYSGEQVLWHCTMNTEAWGMLLLAVFARADQA